MRIECPIKAITFKEFNPLGRSRLESHRKPKKVSFELRRGMGAPYFHALPTFPSRCEELFKATSFTGSEETFTGGGALNEK